MYSGGAIKTLFDDTAAQRRCGGCQTAYLSNQGRYTTFTVNEKTVKFITGKNLEKYTSVVEWDNGYLVVMSKNYGEDEEEDYIDLIPILKNLYMDPETFLKNIKEVEIRNA